jgi:hypothetical protein
VCRPNAPRDAPAGLEPHLDGSGDAAETGWGEDPQVSGEFAMRVSSVVLLVSVAIAGASCSASSHTRVAISPARAADADRGSVYETVLSTYCASGAARLVVDPHRIAGWPTELGIRPPGVAEETRTDFASRPGGAMPTRLATPRTVIWLSHEAWWAMDPWDTADGGDARRWSGFHTRYPDSAGWMRFSDVGFSRDGTEALVHVAISSGPEFTDGWFFVLRRTGREWRVVGKYLHATS